ncbi:MAG: hypothetical protein ACXQTE_01385 [Methanosarcinaceae archaeon]
MQTLEINVPDTDCQHDWHSTCEEIDATKPDSKLIKQHQCCLKCRGGRIIRWRESR